MGHRGAWHGYGPPRSSVLLLDEWMGVTRASGQMEQHLERALLAW